MRRPVPSRLVLLLGNHLYFTQPVDATAPALTYPSFPKCLGLLSESPLPTAARRSADHLLLMESPSLPIHCHDAARYVTVAPHFGGLISGRSLSLRCRPVRKAGPCADRRLHIRFETVILQCNTTFDDLRFLFNQTIFSEITPGQVGFPKSLHQRRTNGRLLMQYVYRPDSQLL